MTISRLDASDSRVLVWFSCGAASAVAAHMALAKYGRARTHIVYCNTLATEHPDNIRFLADVERWLGITVEIIGSDKYDTVDDVFMRERYMAGINGARCTTEMKKIPRYAYQRPDDIHIFGLTADEEKRIALFIGNNFDLTLDWILYEAGVTKDDCYGILADGAGIELPKMYSYGFKNNNCIGCVKAQSPVYWAKIRRHFPEVFARRVAQSRELGVRLIKYHGERMFLDEMPFPITDKRTGLSLEDEADTEDIECGPVCVTPRREEA